MKNHGSYFHCVISLQQHYDYLFRAQKERSSETRSAHKHTMMFRFPSETFQETLSHGQYHNRWENLQILLHSVCAKNDANTKYYHPKGMDAGIEQRI